AAAALSAMALPGLRFWQGLQAAEPQLKKDNKSLIILWMGGGPSHMDLWDLKPNTDNAGEFKPMKTSASGVEISELLPTVANEMKHLAIVRSLVSNEGSHDRGTVLMNTGHQPSPIAQYPAMGAMASSQLTPKEAALPGFIGIGGVAQRIGPGFLGSLYSPFTIQNAGQPPENIRPPSTVGGDDADREARMHRRQRLFYTVAASFGASLMPEKLGTEERKSIGDAAQAHETIYGKAFDLTIPKPGSNLKTVFEVKSEPAKVIEAYGGDKNGFGMGCLLARKLVEAGVTCVEVDL